MSKIYHFEIGDSFSYQCGDIIYKYILSSQSPEYLHLIMIDTNIPATVNIATSHSRDSFIKNIENGYIKATFNISRFNPNLTIRNEEI